MAYPAYCANCGMTRKLMDRTRSAGVAFKWHPVDGPCCEGSTMAERSNPSIFKAWISGDFVYGAIATGLAPSGTAHLLVNGREYPVAQLRPTGESGYAFVRWVNRSEPFPEAR